MSKTLANLEWPDGKTNPSGIKPIAYAVRKSDIVTFPTINADPAAPADYIAYDGDFVLKALALFITIYSTQGKGKLTFEPTGEKDCQGFLNKGTLSYPDISDNAKAMALRTINSNIIYIVPHYVSGGEIRYVVLGSENFDSTTTMKGDSGDAFGSAKGVTIEIEAPDFLPLPIYTGLIQIDGGTLNCATGKFTPKGEVPPVE